MPLQDTQDPVSRCAAGLWGSASPAQGIQTLPVLEREWDGWVEIGRAHV